MQRKIEENKNRTDFDWSVNKPTQHSSTVTNRKDKDFLRNLHVEDFESFLAIHARTDEFKPVVFAAIRSFQPIQRVSGRGQSASDSSTCCSAEKALREASSACCASQGPARQKSKSLAHCLIQSTGVKRRFHMY